MRILRLAVAVLLPLALWGGHLQASGFENTGLGTTARGMAGAFRAVADDWSAAYYNPAGYAFIIDNQLGGSVALINFRNEITPNFVEVDDFGNSYGWGIVNGQKVYNFHRILNNPSAGLVVRLPFWGETVFGLSAFQPFDQSLRWRLYDPEASGMRAYNEDAVGSRKIPGHHYLVDLDVVAIQLTASREFKPEKLSVGIGLQLLRGDLWFSDLTFRTNPRLTAPDITDKPGVFRRPWEKVPEFHDSQGRGWSFGIRAGVMWKLNEKIDLAATAYLPFDITIKGDSYFTFIMPKPDYAVVLPNTADFLFVSGYGDFVNLTSEFETKLKLPSSLGVGVAYKATEKLTVALDAEYTLWSEYDGLEFSFTDFANLPGRIDSALVDGEWQRYTRLFEPEFFQSNLANPVDWENTVKVALGFRYQVHPKLTLLAGGGLDQSPARNSTELTPQFMDLGTKKSVNAGGILHIDQWDVGLITSYYNYPEINLEGLTDVDNSDTFDNFPGEYKASTYESVLSLGYRF
ncbi:MAG: outer membrane protein transport protein [Candidatus Zixiibacteriota bacterium]